VAELREAFLGGGFGHVEELASLLARCRGVPQTFFDSARHSGPTLLSQEERQATSPRWGRSTLGPIGFLPGVKNRKETGRDFGSSRRLSQGGIDFERDQPRVRSGGYEKLRGVILCQEGDLGGAGSEGEPIRSRVKTNRKSRWARGCNRESQRGRSVALKGSLQGIASRCSTEECRPVARPKGVLNPRARRQNRTVTALGGIFLEKSGPGGGPMKRRRGSKQNKRRNKIKENQGREKPLPSTQF